MIAIVITTNLSNLELFFLRVIPIAWKTWHQLTIDRHHSKYKAPTIGNHYLNHDAFFPFFASFERVLIPGRFARARVRPNVSIPEPYTFVTLFHSLDDI